MGGSGKEIESCRLAARSTACTVKRDWAGKN